MPYLRPDDSRLEQWSSVVDVLRQGSHADHGLMHGATAVIKWFTDGHPVTRASP